MALLVLGPLIWGAVLAQNDLHDLVSDRASPRKATAPLVTGAVSARRLQRWYYGIAVAALACALYVGPLFVLGVGVLFAAALYVPTTVTDLAADTGAGDTTFAVRFGAGSAYRIGVGLWGAALVFSLVCAWLDVLVPRSTLTAQLVMAPVLLTAYAILTRRPTITRLAMVSVLFGVPTVGFALAYAGS